MSRSPGAISENARPHRHHAGSAIADSHYESRATSNSGCRTSVPVRIRVAVPPEGSSDSLDRIIAWLDAELRCGWVDLDSIQRARRRQRCAGHLFRRYNVRTAFVARWCVAQKVDIVDGVYRVRGDEPTPRVGAALYSRPASSPACRNPEEPCQCGSALRFLAGSRYHDRNSVATFCDCHIGEEHLCQT